MAILNLPIGYFELTLLEREFPDASGIDRTWISCRVVLSMSAGTKSITIENLRNVYVQDTDLPRLFHGVENFLNDCKQEHLIPEFVFLPLEAPFSLNFVSGSVDEEFQEGGVVVYVMVNLGEMIDLSMGNDFIGGCFHVDIKPLFRFLEELQRELSGLN